MTLSDVDRILAIDPGPASSGWVTYDGQRVTEKGYTENDVLLKRMRGLVTRSSLLVFEQMSNYGEIVGAHVFESVFWCGRFVQEAERLKVNWGSLPRPEIKRILTGYRSAKEKDVRAALLQYFGSSGQEPIGPKAAPGPVHGVSGHMWSALAVAVAWVELDRQQRGCA